MKLRSKLTFLSVSVTILALSICLLLVLHLVTDQLRRTDEDNLQKALHMCSTNLLSGVNTSSVFWQDSWRDTTLRSVIDYQFSLYARLLQDEKTYYSLVGQTTSSAPVGSEQEPWYYLYHISPYNLLELLPPETISSLFASSSDFEENPSVIRPFFTKQPPLLIGAIPFSISQQNFYLYITMDVSDTQAQITQLRLTFFFILIAASFCLMFLLILLIRRALAPVELLNEQAQAIAAGDYTRRTAAALKTRANRSKKSLLTKRKLMNRKLMNRKLMKRKLMKKNQPPARTKADEITQLSDSFDQMTDSIEETIRTLDLQLHKQKLLLAALTHELKTPMTAIIGYSDSLLHMPLSDLQRETCTRHIHEAGKRTEALSQKMIELIGLTEEQRIEKVTFSATEFLKGLEEEFPNLIAIECSLQTLYGDPVLLHSLLQNLIENARKAYDQDFLSMTAEPEQPLVQIKLFAASSFVTITVSDHGRGIPPEQLALVTEPFYRIDKARSRKQGGIGLGLTLCQLIAQRHGGTLEIKSTPGIGTMVTVTLAQEEPFIPLIESHIDK